MCSPPHAQAGVLLLACDILVKFGISPGMGTNLPLPCLLGISLPNHFLLLVIQDCFLLGIHLVKNLLDS
jgi:hypothetical protein